MTRILLLLSLLATPLLAKMEHTPGEVKAKVWKTTRHEDKGWLLLSIAEMESSFNPWALGPTGDYGLFQFTAIGLAEAQRECPRYSHVKLTDLLGEVVLSTKIATCLLDRLSKVHDGNIVEMLIAYNAGSRAALLWGQRKGKIPDVTRRYVMRILNRYHSYRRITWEK